MNLIADAVFRADGWTTLGGMVAMCMVVLGVATMVALAFGL